MAATALSKYALPVSLKANSKGKSQSIYRAHDVIYSLLLVAYVWGKKMRTKRVMMKQDVIGHQKKPIYEVNKVLFVSLTF